MLDEIQCVAVKQRLLKKLRESSLPISGSFEQVLGALQPLIRFDRELLTFRELPEYVDLRDELEAYTYTSLRNEFRVIGAHTGRITWGHNRQEQLRHAAPPNQDH